MDNFPDSFLSIQPHVGNDGYDIAWCGQRATFYGVGGIPATWFGGVLECEGAYTNDNQQYNWYNSQRQQRANTPTDVTIELSGVETAAQTYDITATVAIEAGGTGKDVKLHFVEVLDYYPASADDRYRNCVVEHQGGATHTLAAGESVTVTKSFAITGMSWTNRDDARIVVFVREPGSPGPKQVYNSAVTTWPFSPPDVDGDVDGDGDVDLADLSALLATYGLCAGDGGYNDDADFVDDDCIALSDLAVLLGNYGYGT